MSGSDENVQPRRLLPLPSPGRGPGREGSDLDELQSLASNSRSGIGQTKEQIPGWRSEGDAVRAVGGRDRVTAGRPTRWGGEIAALLQSIAAGVGPLND